jgi:prepilin-type N-terminal cleavage/methylation domain-containing protein
VDIRIHRLAIHWRSRLKTVLAGGTGKLRILIWPSSTPMSLFVEQPMKTQTGKSSGFTLVEILTVIAIIGILAAMLLVVLVQVQKKARATKAKKEVTDIVTAIQAYDSAYGQFPISTDVRNLAGNQDFTYGDALLTSALGPGSYGANNSEVMAILMDITNYPTGGPTANVNHSRNTQQRSFLAANMVSDATLPGVGPDLVYRDPWGMPYIITLDLSCDDRCRDEFYRRTAVSGMGGTNLNSGLNGLANPDDTPDNFLYHGKVMVWSAGPDKAIAPGLPANQGANKDNILSWKD